MKVTDSAKSKKNFFCTMFTRLLTANGSDTLDVLANSCLVSCPVYFLPKKCGLGTRLSQSWHQCLIPKHIHVPELGSLGTRLGQAAGVRYKRKGATPGESPVEFPKVMAGLA